MNSDNPVFIIIAAVVMLASASLLARPLHDAARAGDMSAVERMLEKGADIEALDASDLTPLVVAALAGQRGVVALLIQHGANPRGRDGNGFTALHAAAYEGHLDIVTLLVDQGADINDQDNAARLSALHAAAERGYLDIAEYLLEQGARVDLIEGSGWTPVMRATLKSHADMVKLLRDHGAVCSDGAGDVFLSYCMNAGT